MSVSTRQKWRAWARRLKVEAHAVWLAARDPRTPWYARLAAAAVVAYAFSPIDLIPDPIPVLGHLDDLVLVPLGLWLALRLIPPPVLADCRERARAAADEARPTSWQAAIVIVLLWLTLAALAGLWLFRWLGG